MFKAIPPVRRPLRAVCVAAAIGGVLACSALSISAAHAQALVSGWNGYGGNAQHSGNAPAAAQPLQNIHWHTSVDLNVSSSNTSELFIHYGSPIVTARNTVIATVRQTSGGFVIHGIRGSDGTSLWTQSTNYVVPPHDWIPSCSSTLTPNQRLYIPNSGGTVSYRNVPDSATAGTTGQIAFYSTNLATYTSNRAAYDGSVFINTPITSDSEGNIYFGFMVTGANPSGLASGIARISTAGVGTWVSAAALSPDMVKVAHNCAPALSVDGKTVYVAISNGNGANFANGYLVALNSQTLAFQNKAQLIDPESGQAALVPEDGTASPTVGTDGDVYFGVLENPFPENNDRGWLLHFTRDLSQRKTPGAFGWDDTTSIVPASMVASYHGASKYLMMTKYNNYGDPGLNGNGVNKVAVLDPNATATDSVTGVLVMKEVLTAVGPTPDPAVRNASHPNAVKEWCINAAAVDPFTKNIFVNSEDGHLYRWDMTTGLLDVAHSILLTAGVGEAYTPTVIGPDGTIYAINNAILFALGR